MGEPRTSMQENPRQALLRHTRRAAVLGALSSISAVLLPPVGLIGGIFSIVSGARLTSPLRSSGVTVAGAVIPIVSGAFAVVVGAVLTGLMIVVGPQLLDYRDCMAGANTELAKQACDAELSRSLSDRLLG